MNRDRGAAAARKSVVREEAGRLAVACVLLLVPAFWILSPLGRSLSSAWIRGGVLLVCGISGGLLLPLRGSQWLVRIFLGLAASAALIYLLQPFTLVTSYPFSIDWAEGNRFWGASLYFRADRNPVVGDWVLPAYLTPGLNGLYGLPFLLPRPGIALLRFWEASLPVFSALAMSMVLFFRPWVAMSRNARLLMALWGFLFLMQGPIYPPLLLAAIALLLLWSRERPLRSGLIVGVASFYLGLSRWTWMIAPAAWGATGVLVADCAGRARPRRRWAQATGYGLAGAAGGALSLAWTRWVAGRPVMLYFGALHHVLLKYRLLPNATNRLGILAWILLAAAPTVSMLLWAWWSRHLERDAWSVAAIAAIAVGFFGVGLAASIKIGGGEDLHDLDMFLVYLVLLAALAGASLGARGWLRPGSWPLAVRVSLTAAVLIPSLTVAVAARPPAELPSRRAAEEGLATVEAAASRAARSEPVLFIDQRQLFAFDALPDVPLVMEYEMHDLLDRAMAGDQAYLRQFHHDLETHRFSLIVVNPLHVIWMDRSAAFGEENDIWTREVVLPILNDYEPVAELDAVGVWLLAPIGER